MVSLTDNWYLCYYGGMDELNIDDDITDFDEMFGDLNMTMLHSGEKHHVLVYGTLMSNMRNHARLDEKSTKLIAHNAILDGDFHMFPVKTVSGYAAPIVMYGESGESRGIVHGELYEVSNAMLMKLDMFEGHSEVYRRMMLPIAHDGTANSRVMNAWAYIYANERPNEKALESLGMDTVVRYTGPNNMLHYRWAGEKG